MGAAGRQIGYVYGYDKNIQNLRQKVEDLSIVIVNIQRKIEAARTVGDIILHEVSDWQEKAARAKVDAENFLNEDLSDGHESCLKGLCPIIFSRYVVSKDAKMKTTDVVHLVEQGNMFQTVSQTAPLPSYDSTLGSPYFEVFESRKSAFDDIMHSLEDEAVRFIGIYGTGGVGKTAMADHVAAQAENKGVFNEILKVAVTQNPVIGKIQDELAEQLNLERNKTTEVGKAKQLRQRLRNEKKMLLILDDVWNQLDLNGIGIPFANENTNGCKIILTTRSERVCLAMKVNKKIPIDFLSGEEAWILFRRQMENDIPHDLHEVAKQVCKECAGLPIAILVIGRMLNGNPSCLVWNNVLEKLRKSQLKHIPELGVSTKVYASLADSYHKLVSDEAKSCFLFCSLFPEDFNIPTEYILRYGKGVGVANEMEEEETLLSERGGVHHLVGYLKSHCLLLEGGDEVHVKMHDVIRDVAISIASEEGQHVFLSEMGENLKKWPRKKTYDCYTALSVEFNACTRVDFPDKLDCANLKTLIMLSSTRYRTLTIPQNFFHAAIKLRVLLLRKMKISKFPESIKSLVDLEVLGLEVCDLGDLSWIGNLKKLQMLILQGSSFNLLPTEIRQLSHLRLLDLRDCRRLKSMSDGVISSLSRLEELFLPLSTDDDDERGVLRWNIEDLKALFQLEALEMRVPPNSNLMELPQDSSFWAKLAKFRIYINQGFDYLDDDLSSKNTLKLKGVSLSGWAAVLLKRVERLCVEELNALENLDVLYVGRRSFPKLQHFEADACQGITELLTRVVDVWPVSHLSVMRIFRCNLEYLFTPSMAKRLPRLQTLEIMSCQNLKSIVGGCQENEIEEEVIFHQLEELYLGELPMLVSFYPDSREGCASQPLFTRQVGLPKLGRLLLKSVDLVKEIWAGDIPPPPNSSLCELHIMQCHVLVSAIPPAVLPSLHRLEWVMIRSCNSLREIVGSETALAGVASSGLPKLRAIWLADLPKLENLFSVPLLTCQRLSCISIKMCGRLINLFSSPSTAFAFAPNLEELKIRACEKMEEIVSGGSTGKDVVPGDHASSSPRSLQIIFPRLKLLALGHRSLPNLTSLCPSGYLLSWESSLEIERYSSDSDNDEFNTLLTPSVSTLHLEEIAG